MASSTTTITITYERPGTTPPIFIAGSFTTPAWQPIELDQQQVTGEYVFSKTFDIAPGIHRYKFRVGFGDWWVCDDTKDTETDEAANVNNVIVVQSVGSNDLGQPGGESSLFDRGAETSSKTASDHCNSPSLGLDGVNDSNEELARSLRKEVALTEKIMADFHDVNGDIEPDDSGLEKARKDDVTAHEAPDALANDSVTMAQQIPLVNDHPVWESHAKDSSLTSKPSTKMGQGPAHKESMVEASEEKAVPQKPSVSTVSVTNGQKNQKDFWLIGFYRVVVQGVVGSMSTLLCGKRRK